MESFWCAMSIQANSNCLSKIHGIFLEVKADVETSALCAKKFSHQKFKILMRHSVIKRTLIFVSEFILFH